MAGRREQASSDGFNLAFLDVMACGLGAVILLLLLVDFKTSTLDTSDEQSRLTQELADRQQLQQQLEQSIADTQQAITQQRAQQLRTQGQLQQTQASLRSAQQAITEQQTRVAGLVDEQAALLAKNPPASNLELSGTGEQNYIVGMPVKGKNIGILLDKSHSMMAVELTDILWAMHLPNPQKVQQPKWIRATRITKWLLSRVPPDSKVTLVVFSEDAKILGQQQPIMANSAEQMQQISIDLVSVIPEGGSNLRKGFETLIEANRQLDAIYLVTDGLPTLGESMGGNHCKTIKRRQTISAKCRRDLATKTMIDVLNRKKPPTINVILLPLEGDPYAAEVYWQATWLTGGKMLSPALEWQ